MAVYKFDDYGNQIMPDARSVSEINEYIKYLIEEEMLLQDLYVNAEISNFKKHSTGHLYFTLKDDKSEIRAVMFKSSATKIKFAPKDGMKVLVHARVGVYQQAGSYQLYVDSMQPDGLGSLYLAYEQLKDRLSNEGLFDESHKKFLPKYPKKIGVITSPTGAAIRDIIQIAQRRYPYAKIILYPSLVQGPEAPSELIRGVEYFDITKSVDVIIIGRGGGSIEDLWAFNNEALAKAIYKSKTPIISAVGHEIDFTICDFVSDKRAPTPSAAAELATPDISNIEYRLNNFISKSYNYFLKTIENSKNRLNNIIQNKFFKNPISIFDSYKMDLIFKTDKLNNVMIQKTNDLRLRFATLNSKLVALNPMAVLSRGYGAIFTQNNSVIKSVEQIKKDDIVNIKIADGEVGAVVKSVKKGDKTYAEKRN